MRETPQLSQQSICLHLRTALVFQPLLHPPLLQIPKSYCSTNIKKCEVIGVNPVIGQMLEKVSGEVFMPVQEQIYGNSRVIYGSGTPNLINVCYERCSTALIV